MSGEDDNVTKASDGAKRPLTEREVAARRENSKRSTGPKTPEGKARVSQNALRHGGYARATAILSGPFAESPAEVAAFHDELVAQLDPRDPLECALARDVARLMWRQRRIDLYENLALGDDEFDGAEAYHLAHLHGLDVDAAAAERVLADLNPDISVAVVVWRGRVRESALLVRETVVVEATGSRPRKALPRCRLTRRDRDCW